MQRPDPTNNHDQAWATAESNYGSDAAKHHALPGLTRGQRWLAGATAGAVLLSGLNALVQVWKVLLEYVLRHG